MMLAACELELSDNGALDGNWQLRRIDTLATGGSCDMSSSYIYWGVENRILQVRDIDSNLKILFRFAQHGDSLTIHHPNIVNNKDNLTELEDEELLLPLGINGIQVDYQVERLSKSTLILKDEWLRLQFRKY